MEALSIRFGTAHFLHLLLDKGKARIKGKGKGSDPNNHIRIGKGRRPTPISRTRPLSKLKPNHPTNHPGIIGVESM